MVQHFFACTFRCNAKRCIGPFICLLQCLTQSGRYLLEIGKNSPRKIENIIKSTEKKPAIKGKKEMQQAPQIRK
jgi:hypothetical protein